MEPIPFSRMPFPHHIEPDFRKAFFHMIQTCKGCVEFFPAILSMTGAITRDETVLAAAPFAKDVNGIVERRGADFRQKSQFEPGNKVLAFCSYAGFIFRRERPRSHRMSRPG